MKKMNKKGFTIVELVIVIAVIAILAAVLIPTFSGVVNKANDSARTQEMTNTLKVTLAGNASTGALAANTVFVVASGDDLYTSVYNGNKLGDITKFDSEHPYTKNASVENIINYDTVIMGTSETSPDQKAVANIAKLFGGTSANYANKKVTVTMSGGSTIELEVVWNVDFSTGTVVLYPAN